MHKPAEWTVFAWLGTLAEVCAVIWGWSAASEGLSIECIFMVQIRCRGPWASKSSSCGFSSFYPCPEIRLWQSEKQVSLNRGRSQTKSVLQVLDPGWCGCRHAGRHALWVAQYPTMPAFCSQIVTANMAEVPPLSLSITPLVFDSHYWYASGGREGGMVTYSASLFLLWAGQGRAHTGSLTHYPSLKTKLEY